MADSLKPVTTRPTTRRSRGIVIPPISSLSLDEPNREHQATLLRHDAYQIARIIGRDIRIKLRTNTEKGLRELIWSCGVMMDKVLGGVESAGLTLHVPGILLDKLMVAINMRQSGTQVVTNQQDTSLHNGYSATSEDNTTQKPIQSDSVSKEIGMGGDGLGQGPASP